MMITAKGLPEFGHNKNQRQKATSYVKDEEEHDKEEAGISRVKKQLDEVRAKVVQLRQARWEKKWRRR